MGTGRRWAAVSGAAIQGEVIIEIELGKFLWKGDEPPNRLQRTAKQQRKAGWSANCITGYFVSFPLWTIPNS